MQHSASCSLGVPALPPSPFLCRFWGGYLLFKPEKICGREEESMASQWLAGHQGEPMGNIFVSIHAILFRALQVVS